MSLSSQMAQQELSNPNSMYYLGRPSVIDEIRGYMSGTSYGRWGSFSGKRNMYIGQPQEDTFETLSKAKDSRRNENIFKLSMVALGLLVARKIPGAGKLGKGLGSCAIGILKAPFKLLGWLVK